MTEVLLGVLGAGFALAWWADAAMPQVLAAGIYQNKEA